MKTVKLYHYGHKRALFDTKACADGFREDRRYGLIYGPYYLKNENRFAMCAEEASMLERFCPYCNVKEGAPK